MATTEQKNDYLDLSSFLINVGLGSLFTTNSKGEPGGWLWTQILEGIDTEATLLPRLEATPVFQKRYKIIFDQRARVANGEAVTVPTVQDVQQYEKDFKTVMLASGLPPTFYDTFEDAHKAIASNLTMTQIENRINKSIGIVNDLSPDIKAAFKEFYGDATDGALFAAVLDPQKTLDFLENRSQAASVAAFGKQQDITITKTQAEDYATWKQSYNEQQIQSDIQQAASYSQLTDSNLGESGQQLDAGIAFSAGAMGNVTDQTTLENRLIGRKTQQGSIGGGALTTTKGIVGA